MTNKPVATPLNQLLRGIPQDAWAEITLKSGWIYHTNIGVLVNMAAEEIEQSALRIRTFRNGLALSIFVNIMLLATLMWYLK